MDHSPGSCFGRLCPTPLLQVVPPVAAGKDAAPDNARSSLANDGILDDVDDPGSNPAASLTTHRSHTTPPGDPVPQPPPPPPFPATPAATCPLASPAGSPGKKSAAAHGCSASRSACGLMEGELGKVSAGPVPPALAGLWLLLLRLLEDHLPLESPDDLGRERRTMYACGGSRDGLERGTVAVGRKEAHRAQGRLKR